MLQDTSITTRERWVDVDEFPNYSVSDHGNVMNNETGRPVTPVPKPRGIVMVGLMGDGPHGRIQHKRSLPLLVARAFLPAPRYEDFNTPINLDGDRNNNRYDNLMWRPLWFARKYARQFEDVHVTVPTPIEDIETGEIYNSSMHAAVVNGLLDTEIVLTMHTNGRVWPTGQIFRHPVRG